MSDKKIRLEGEKADKITEKLFKFIEENAEEHINHCMSNFDYNIYYDLKRDEFFTRTVTSNTIINNPDNIITVFHNSNNSYPKFETSDTEDSIENIQRAMRKTENLIKFDDFKYDYSDMNKEQFKEYLKNYEYSEKVEKQAKNIIEADKTIIDKAVMFNVLNECTAKELYDKENIKQEIKRKL